MGIGTMYFKWLSHHPIVGKDVRVGKNVTIWNYCVIQDNVEIGDNVKIGSFVDIGRDVKIGKDCNIQCCVSIPNRTTIGKNVFMGPQVQIANGKYPPAGDFDPVIEDDVVIGGNASIITKRIGKGAVVGAGSVVTKDIPPGEVWAGNPAKFLYRRDEFERRKSEWEDYERQRLEAEAKQEAHDRYLEQERQREEEEARRRYEEGG